MGTEAAAGDGSPSKEHAVVKTESVRCTFRIRLLRATMQRPTGLLAPAGPVAAWLPSANSLLTARGLRVHHAALVRH